VTDTRDCFSPEQQRLLDELLGRRDRRLAEFENRIHALEQRDPAQVGFEAYRRRAREIEDRREKEQAP
jgi:hypothetical protein